MDVSTWRMIVSALIKKSAPRFVRTVRMQFPSHSAIIVAMKHKYKLCEIQIYDPVKKKEVGTIHP
jgi:hypothetical protein